MVGGVMIEYAWAHTFTEREWQVIRTALRTCETIERQEERGANTEDEQTGAARRAMMYGILADRISGEVER